MLSSTPFRLLRVLVLACVLVALTAGSAAADLTSNASFELGPDPGEAMQLAMGSTAITGWVVTRNPIDYVGTRWNAAAGTRSLGLNGTNPGGIAQTFATVPGEVYTVHFFMAGDAFANPILKHMRVQAAGQSQDYVFDATHSWPWDLGWLEKTFTFTANASSTMLEFYSLDAGDTGPTLDSVVVQGPPVSVPLGERTGFALAPPYPNPARHFWLTFAIPADMALRLSVWDVRGREVCVVAEGPYPAGRYTRLWDGSTPGGRAPAGLYIIRLDAPGGTLVRKAVLSR